MNEHETFKLATARYRAASGNLFLEPCKKKSEYAKGGWFLHDQSDELIAIVNNKDIIFGANLWAFMLQSANP